jgi:selenocysteine lyase/cysteine desulfurase
VKEGAETVRAHELALIKKLREGLCEIPSVRLYGSDRFDQCLATLSFTLENLGPQELGAILDESYGIAARTGLHCAPLVHQAIGTHPEGTVRLSLGYFNRLEEVDRCLEAVREIAKQFQLT